MFGESCVILRRKEDPTSNQFKDEHIDTIFTMKMILEFDALEHYRCIEAWGWSDFSGEEWKNAPNFVAFAGNVTMMLFKSLEP